VPHERDPVVRARPQQQIHVAKTIGQIMNFETPHANPQSLLAEA
jgi:hypothetical protein